jgi:hypothetical protein
MKKLGKIFLTASVAAFALSLTGLGSEFAWGFLKPLSAILFIAFFITNLLVNEYARFDEEEKRKLALVKPKGPALPVPVRGRSRKAGQNPSFAASSVKSLV